MHKSIFTSATDTGNAQNAVTPPAYAYVNSAGDYIDAASTCCSHARDAARNGRITAAQGLMQTAISMYNRAARVGNSDADLAERERFESMVNDLCYSAQVIEVEMVARQAAAPGQAKEGA